MWGIGRTELARCTHSLRGLLHSKGVLLSHSGDNGDENLLSVVKHGLDLLADLALGELDVVLGLSVTVHEVEEAVVDVDELVLVPDNVGDVHVVGGRRQILELLVGEDLCARRRRSDIPVRCQLNLSIRR